MMTLGQLAELAGYTAAGNSDTEIKGMCYAYDPKDGMLAVAMTPQEALCTSADNVLTTGTPLDFSRNFIYSHDEIYCSIVRVANILVANGVLKDYRSPSAFSERSGIMLSEKAKVGEGTDIGPFSVIEDGAVLGNNCRIGSGVYIGADTIIGNNTVVGSGTKISTESVFHNFDGAYHHFAGAGRVVVGENVFIGSNTVIQRGTLTDTIIGNGSVIGDMVDIGHDCVVGRNCRIVSQCGISGNVRIGENSVIFGQSGVQNFVQIGRNVTIKARTAVSKNVCDGEIVSGLFGRNHIKDLRFYLGLKNLLNERK